MNDVNLELNCREFSAMAGASTLFAAFAAPPSFSSRTRCSMHRHSEGGGSLQRVFGIQGKGQVVALRAGLWRGVCRASDQTSSEGIATSPEPLEVQNPAHFFTSLSPNSFVVMSSQFTEVSLPCRWFMIHIRGSRNWLWRPRAPPHLPFPTSLSFHLPRYLILLPSYVDRYFLC